MSREKKSNYKKCMIPGAVLFFVLIFALAGVGIYMEQSGRRKVIIYFLLTAVFADGAGMFLCYRRWREEIKNILFEFQELYCSLLQAECPQEKKSGLPEELSCVISHLKKALNEALISSLALKQAEINVLQSQINPHFLYNILDSIRGQALSEGVPEIADMTESLANYFRYCVTKDDGIVALADELKNVENYWKIQQYRFGNKISMQVVMDRGILHPDEYEIPKLILQPIVENAIFHGLETKQGKGKVIIRIERTKTRLIILVMDNGIGMDEQELEKLRKQLKEKQHVISRKEPGQQRSSGIALLNVNERIKLHYGDEYGLQISSSRFTGTEVEFVLPIRTPVFRNKFYEER